MDCLADSDRPPKKRVELVPLRLKRSSSALLTPTSRSRERLVPQTPRKNRAEGWPQGDVDLDQKHGTVRHVATMEDVGREPSRDWVSSQGIALSVASGSFSAACVLGAMIVAIGFLGGCDQAERPPLEWRMRGGGTLGELIANVDPAVVLVMEPSQCISCTNLLAAWLDWRQEHPAAFDLVLSRQPESWERFRLAPLPVSGILRESLDIADLPTELVISDGQVVYRSPSLQGVSISPLLAELRDKALGDVILDLPVR